MKKGFMLIEVMVSIILITIVIAALLKQQENSLQISQKLDTIAVYDSILCLGVEETLATDKTIFLKDSMNIKEDKIRRFLKDIKINIKTNQDKDIEDLENSVISIIKVNKTNYTIENKLSKTFYRFHFQ